MKNNLVIFILLIPLIAFSFCPNEKGAGMDVIKTIDLPKPNFDSGVSIEEALKNRRSIRTYLDKSLKLKHISQILWAAYGITQPRESGPDFLRGGLRTAPSAGALYPLEIYLVCGNVESLEPGIYKYNSREHKLEMLEKGDKRNELARAAYGQSHVKNAAADIFYSAIYARTTKKYGERGRKRYVCMDLGHSAENVYLQSYSLNIGTCAVGAFSDEKVEKVMSLPENETPLYIMPLGYME